MCSDGAVVVHAEDIRVLGELFQHAVRQVEHLAVDEGQRPVERVLLELSGELRARVECHDDARSQGRIATVGTLGEHIVKLVVLDEGSRSASRFLRRLALVRFGGSRADRQTGDAEDDQSTKRSLGTPDRLTSRLTNPDVFHRAHQ